MQHLFTYGSLMYDRIWREVIGTTYVCQRAWLDGYERLGVIDADYPVLVPNSDRTGLEGMLRLNVSDEDFIKIDRYESEFYRRLTTPVYTLNSLGETIQVRSSLYALNPEYHYICDGQAWDIEYFEQLRSVSRKSY
ncbi:gamma-glutamylcyclotransferase family protein [Gynuella sp.]|uniref:gamma-glutamylcyclotransferase family protein n=1 Tax=Gynuella sp. TaxID=2969146 RepID=UPI003D0F0657